MLSLDHETSGALRKELNFAGVKISLTAPPRLIEVLDATLPSVSLLPSDFVASVSFTVIQSGDLWEINGSDGSRKVLAAQSALPRVAGALVTSAVASAAELRDLKTMRATVIEKDGRALAMMGDDWESAITLATHLHGRGWRIIGGDHALFDTVTNTVIGIRKSFYVNASSALQLPLRYRKAVEASPWYVTPQGISFYAVDPAETENQTTWASSAKLGGILIVDGAMTDVPSIESVGNRHQAEDRFSRLGVDWQSVALGELQIGAQVETCDVIEQWFSAERS